jgi:hypothetical protein
MAGTIFIGNDKDIKHGDRRLVDPTNSVGFDSLGDLLDEGLTGDLRYLVDSIKNEEWIYMSIFEFSQFEAADYNLVIKAMRSYIATISQPTGWQKNGIDQWNVLETMFAKDERYDPAYHA